MGWDKAARAASSIKLAAHLFVCLGRVHHSADACDGAFGRRSCGGGGGWRRNFALSCGR